MLKEQATEVAALVTAAFDQKFNQFAAELTAKVEGRLQTQHNNNTNYICPSHLGLIRRHRNSQRYHERHTSQRVQQRQRLAVIQLNQSMQRQLGSHHDRYAQRAISTNSTSSPPTCEVR